MMRSSKFNAEMTIRNILATERAEAAAPLVVEDGREALAPRAGVCEKTLTPGERSRSLLDTSSAPPGI